MTVTGREKDGTKVSQAPYSVRLPGFVADEPVGLGDAVKRVTSLVGIRPCGPCTARAERLNGWVVLSGRKR